MNYTMGDHRLRENFKREEERVRVKVGEESFVRCDNPIMNPLVLDLVFDLLSVPILKRCRLVCQKWKETVTRKLLRKSTISLDAEDLTTLSEIQSWMNSYPSKTLFRNFTCDKITHSSYPNIWSLLGSHVKSLVVSHWWDDLTKDLTLKDYEDLLLRRCPSLEEISMPCTKHFRKAHNFLNFSSPSSSQSPANQNSEDPSKLSGRRKKKVVNLNLRVIRVTGNAKPDARFWRIVSVSPKLRRLHVECQLVEEFWNPNLEGRPYWVERMANLQEMEIRSYANEGASGNSANYYVSTPWNLKSATYECYDLSDTDMKGMHEHIRRSLEKLHMVFFNRQYEPWPADKGGDWMTSPKLTKLRHYKLEIDEFCKGSIFCRALVHSMFVPNLETITLSMYDDGENQSEWGIGLFTQIFEDCLSTSDPPIRRGELRRNSLKSLVLPPGMKDTSCILPVLHVFPSLREVTLVSPEPQFVTMVLYHWTSLERFSLTLESEGGVDWNFVLIGWEIMMGVDGTEVGGFSGASIGNLTRLTSLEIKMVEAGENEVGNNEESDEGFLNDLIIHHGLIHLKWAQRISITGHKFSEDAVQILRCHLLPYCYLDLNKSQS